MSACISEPISWLRLERYRLRELVADVEQEIDRHLAACAACRACLAHIDAPRELAPPPGLRSRERAPAARRRGKAARLAVGASLLAAAATVLLWQRTAPAPSPTPPAPRVAFKGGELAINLVRLSGGGIAHDASRFAAGDRFKVQLTCPPGLAGSAHVVVFQSGKVYRPLAPFPLADCGNLRTLPGAFALDGEAPVTVCVAIEGRTALATEPLARRGVAALPASSVCRTIAR